MNEQKNKAAHEAQLVEQSKIEKLQIEREKVTNKIIRTIVDDLEEPGKGNLTTIFAIGILEDTIKHLELNALMCPARHSLKDES